MRRIYELGLAQRVVVVVAIGAVFLVAGSYIQSLGRGHSAPFGWTGYAPLSAAAMSVARPAGQWPGWLHPVIWLALIFVWAGASIRLLRPHDASG